MWSLYLRTLRLLLARLLRSLGYKGTHTLPAAAALCFCAVGLDLAASWWLLSSLSGLRPTASVRGLLSASTTVVLFFLTGPALLLTESIRDRGSRLQAVLGTLPLTHREISLVKWLPGCVVAIALTALLVLPGAAALRGLGNAAGTAALDAAAAVLAGLAAASAVVAGVHIAARGRALAAVRYPTMMLLWLVLSGVESWQSGVAIQAAAASIPSYLLVVPATARIVDKTGTVPLPWLGAEAALAIAGLVALALAARISATPVQRSVLLNWKHRWRPALASAEALRFLRSGTLLTNTAGASVFATGLAALLLRMPVEARPTFAALLLAVALNLTAVPATLIRGLTRSVPPVQLLLGVPARRWAAAQVTAAALLFLLASIPPVAVLCASGIAVRTVAVDGLAYGLAAFGLAIAAGWAIPASPDNPFGQVVVSVAACLLFGVVASVVGAVLPVGSAGWAATLSGAGLGSLGAALVIESRRFSARHVSTQRFGTRPAGPWRSQGEVIEHA